MTLPKFPPLEISLDPDSCQKMMQAAQQASQALDQTAAALSESVLPVWMELARFAQLAPMGETALHAAEQQAKREEMKRVYEQAGLGWMALLHGTILEGLIPFYQSLSDFAQLNPRIFRPKGWKKIRGRLRHQRLSKGKHGLRRPKGRRNA